MTATSAASGNGTNSSSIVKRRFNKQGTTKSSSLLCTIDELEQATLFNNIDDSHSIDDDETSNKSGSTTTSTTGLTSGGDISSGSSDDDAGGKRKGYYYSSSSLSSIFRSTWFLTCWWRVRSLYHRYRCGSRNNRRHDDYRLGNNRASISSTSGTSLASKRVFCLLVGVYVASTLLFRVHPLRLLLLPLLSYQNRRLEYYDVNDDAFSFIHYDTAFSGGAGTTSYPPAPAAAISNIIDMNILLKWPSPPSPSTSRTSNNRKFHLTDKLGVMPASDWNVPDYGNLTVLPSPYNKQQNHNHHQRLVNSNDREIYESNRQEYIKVMDDAEYIRKEYWSHEDVQDIYEKCRTPTWKSTAIPTCNVAHELSLERVKKIHRPHDGHYDESLQDYNMTYMGYVKLLQEEEDFCIMPLGGCQYTLLLNFLVCMSCRFLLTFFVVPSLLSSR